MNNSGANPHAEFVSHAALSLDDVADVIISAKKALILTHVNPDGDCIGSATALAALIRACGGGADVTCPSDVPHRLAFLCEGIGVTALSDAGDLDAYDTVIAVDVASPNQLGIHGFAIPKVNCMIDHHATGEPFAPYYVCDSASSAGEIVYSLYKILRERGACGECVAAARRMYAAILSDSGSFKYSNTTPSTHYAAADLLSEINGSDDDGADTVDISRALFGQRTLKEMIAQMLAIQNLRVLEDGRLGVVVMTQDILSRHGLSEDEIGNIVDTPRALEGVLVGVSIKQSSADRTVFRVSSRANADIDVSAVCARFGGGGHVRAAGCTVIADTPDEAYSAVCAAFGEAVRNYRK